MGGTGVVSSPARGHSGSFGCTHFFRPTHNIAKRVTGQASPGGWFFCSSSGSGGGPESLAALPKAIAIQLLQAFQFFLDRLRRRELVRLVGKVRSPKVGVEASDLVGGRIGFRKVASQVAEPIGLLAVCVVFTSRMALPPKAILTKPHPPIPARRRLPVPESHSKTGACNIVLSGNR